VITLALFALASAAPAQASASYDLSWHTLAGGEGRMKSGGHVLLGTVGQPLVGTTSGRGHTLESGFWGRGAKAEETIYLPLVLRSA
jgi:hypothetical protein